MTDLEAEMDRIAFDTGLSGVVHVQRGAQPILLEAYGLADRARSIPNTVDTQFGIASGTKAFTALVIVDLIRSGRLGLDTPIRSLLGDDLPLVRDDVTMEHLLAHRSGIGDYFGEAEHDLTEYVLRVPVHELDTTEGYLPLLDGRPSVFEPDARFEYNNSGYVLLALLAERVAGAEFHDLVRRIVCERAGLRNTAFLRSDELPTRAAMGYLWADHPRTNVFHLPVRGSGDGGLYSTASDVHAFWQALFAGAIVPLDWVNEMVRPRSHIPAEPSRYGLGFWLDATGDGVFIEGCDSGVSFRSVHDRRTDLTATVLSNTTDGAWPIARLLRERYQS